jgi:RNA polymerase sigma factor (sigma-70 family)
VNLPPFEQVLVEHGPDVHRYLVAGVGRQDADDCYQEVMVAALRNYPSLRDASNLRGWLFTIAYSKAIDSHRGRSRRPVPADAVVADVAHPTRHDADDGDVWIAVRELPPMQRAAVLHRYLHDLPFREIASIIGCSEPAARQNVRAGLATLRKDIER